MNTYLKIHNKTNSDVKETNGNEEGVFVEKANNSPPTKTGTSTTISGIAHTINHPETPLTKQVCNVCRTVIERYFLTIFIIK